MEHLPISDDLGALPRDAGTTATVHLAVLDAGWNLLGHRSCSFFCLFALGRASFNNLSALVRGLILTSTNPAFNA